MAGVQPKEQQSMWTRDGVRLDADVYYPEAEGEFPVLLMRQPYGRAIASTVVYAHPTWYAAQGYIVVIQDVRGRGTSEGHFNLFAHEREDGFDTIHWAANLPRSTGQVGMYGFSYQGMTQLYAAVTHPPALRTLCPAMVGYDLYQDWAYEGGAFCYQLNLAWALQLAAETARRQGDSEQYRTLYAAAHQLPLHDPVCAHSGLLQHLDPDSFYHAWLKHPEPDGYWDSLSPCREMQRVDLPMLHIGGWFDAYMRGTLRLYREMAGRSQFPQFLIVGPWAHLPWGRRVGGVDYGAAANNPCDRLQIRWFDHFLKGIDTGLLDNSPIQLFEMGSNQWCTFDQFPTPTSTTYGLSSSGLAGMGEMEGGLHPLQRPQSCTDTLVHDPWRPVPSLGGHAAFPAGSFDRASLDCRSDVLTYTTEPLTEEIHLVGEPIVELLCAIDAPSADLCAVLSTVLPNGSVYNFSQGYQRVYPQGEVNQPWVMTLQPTCLSIPPGHALRLSLSAACSPAYSVNTGTGKPAPDSALIEARIITVALQVGGNSISHLRLPILDESNPGNRV